jgi:hypothetical protein
MLNRNAAPDVRPGMDIQSVTAILILGLLLPLWILFGLADWVQHRKTAIQSTSGWRESVLHVLLTAEAAVPVLAGLYLEINSLVIAVAILAFVAHEITTGLDVGWATDRRYVSATEQRIHDYLTAIPLSILLLVCATHPAALLGLIGHGGTPGDFSIRLKSPPLPAWYLAGFLGLSALNALAFLAELTRCLRHRPARAP